MANDAQSQTNTVGADAHIRPHPHTPTVGADSIRPLENGSMWASTPTKRIENIVRLLKTLTT
ncbi:MAG: hypothetical protein E7553_07365 [Ruminococcaceae bacterium]|nr:hypothetical protein [Oscillospiraceae bacterium]